MAKQIIHKLVDDLDGGDADETVKFALDGVQYEIDLSNANAAKLRDAIRAVHRRGTKVGRGGVVVVGGRAARGRGGATADREQNKAIREWAKKAGKDISDRGRIPQEIVDEYHAKADRSADLAALRHRRRHRRRAGVPLRAGVAVSGRRRGPASARPSLECDVRPAHLGRRRPRRRSGKLSTACGAICPQAAGRLRPQAVADLGGRPRTPPRVRLGPGFCHAGRISLCAYRQGYRNTS